MQPEPVREMSPDDDVLGLLRRHELKRAFDLLFTRYEGKTYRLCCAMLHDPTQAEDTAQDSWVRIWRALGTYDGRASVSTWIYSITRNRCLSAIEARRQLASMSSADVEAEVLALKAEESATEDVTAVLRELIASLPERHRRTLLLFYYEGRSIEEVSLMLAIPEGTVKTLLHRARAELGKQLRRRGLGDPSAWLDVRP